MRRATHEACAHEGQGAVVLGKLVPTEAPHDEGALEDRPAHDVLRSGGW